MIENQITLISPASARDPKTAMPSKQLMHFLWVIFLALGFYYYFFKSYRTDEAEKVGKEIAALLLFLSILAAGLSPLFPWA